MKFKLSWQASVRCHLHVSCFTCRRNLHVTYCFAAATEAHQKDTALAEPADQPAGFAQDAPAAAAAVTAQMNGPIGPCMPQAAPSASALGDDVTTYEAGPHLPSADSNAQQPATGMPCVVLLQPLVLVMEFD